MTAHFLYVKKIVLFPGLEADLLKMCNRLDTLLVKGIKYPHTTAPARSRDKYGRYEIGLNCS